MQFDVMAILSAHSTKRIPVYYANEFTQLADLSAVESAQFIGQEHFRGKMVQ
jgi:hypothetical protein